MQGVREAGQGGRDGMRGLRGTGPQADNGGDEQEVFTCTLNEKDMSFKFIYRDETYDVRIEAEEGDRLRFAWRGADCRADVRKVYTGGYLVNHGQRLSEVMVDGPDENGVLTVRCDGRLWELRMPVPRRLGQAAGGGAGSQNVMSPIPGKIVAVLVEPGEAVEEGQPVLIMEAMKMENELRAGCAGTVGEINVAPGENVDGGRVLVTIT